MEGLYIGAMGMLSSQNHINSHANNIANVNTTGFKFDTMISSVFEEGRAHRNVDGERSFIGDYQNKVVEEGTIVNLKPGSVKLTDGQLDVVINDENQGTTSFFVVSANGENYLTRNGEFEVSNERQLKTVSGAYVLDSNNQPIIIPENAKPTINVEGNLVNSENGEFIAKLQLREVNQDNKYLLNKEYAAMFSYDGEMGQLPVSNSELKSGMLETSNVDMTKEMVDLMSSQKRFQANQKVFVTYDKILEKEANQLMR